jgi:hypothetical protein
MHRIDGPGHLANQFTEGDPQQGQAPTTVTDDWANAVQEEISAVIEGAGIVLDKEDNGQLAAAVQTRDEKGAANGYASLDADARLPLAQTPALRYPGPFVPIGSGTAVTAFVGGVALAAVDATHVVLIEQTNGKLYLYEVDYGTGGFTLIGSGTAVTAFTNAVALAAVDATHVVLIEHTNGKLYLYDAVVHKGRAAPWSAAGGAF